MLETLSNTTGLGTGLLLILLISMFTGLFFWAWSDAQKPVFKRASHLPLEDDLPPTNGAAHHDQRSEPNTQGGEEEAVFEKPIIIETTGKFHLNKTQTKAP